MIMWLDEWSFSLLLFCWVKLLSKVDWRQSVSKMTSLSWSVHISMSVAQRINYKLPASASFDYQQCTCLSDKLDDNGRTQSALRKALSAGLLCRWTISLYDDDDVPRTRLNLGERAFFVATPLTRLPSKLYTLQIFWIFLLDIVMLRRCICGKTDQPL